MKLSISIVLIFALFAIAAALPKAKMAHKMRLKSLRSLTTHAEGLSSTETTHVTGGCDVKHKLISTDKGLKVKLNGICKAAAKLSALPNSKFPQPSATAESCTTGCGSTQKSKFLPNAPKGLYTACDPDQFSPQARCFEACMDGCMPAATPVHTCPGYPPL